MPGPPPPPPPGCPPPMMPPPPVSNKGTGEARSALLQSIQKGTKLKKTVTNDKSAPMIGKVSSNISNSNSSSTSLSSPRTGNNGTVNGLGGLFAGGIPKLKPTGKLGPNNSDAIKTPTTPPSKSFNSIQNELKKQMATDGRNMNRGPPPPAPTRSYNNQTTDDSSRSNTRNGFHSGLNHHRKTNSSVSLNDSVENNNTRPVLNFGKPNVAPKPPTLNGKPAAPKLINGKPIGRAQSMRSPRSPSPQSPDNNNPDFNKFGTVRNISQNLAHSLGNLSQVKTRPSINGRPTAPPPSIPNIAPPPPPSKTVKPPNHAPPPPPVVNSSFATSTVSLPSLSQSFTPSPPPPPSSTLPQAPVQPPPPPPHRTGPPVPSRAPPAIPGNNAPPPPPRCSSIRDGSNNRRPPPTTPPTSTLPTTTSTTTTSMAASFETRFHFHSVVEFPQPMPFRGVQKIYTSRQGSKQQAPLPPNQIHLTNRLWESSTC